MAGRYAKCVVMPSTASCSTSSIHQGFNIDPDRGDDDQHDSEKT